jgi:hypothetical protein
MSPAFDHFPSFSELTPQLAAFAGIKTSETLAENLKKIKQTITQNFAQQQ